MTRRMLTTLSAIMRTIIQVEKIGNIIYLIVEAY